MLKSDRWYLPLGGLLSLLFHRRQTSCTFFFLLFVEVKAAYSGMGNSNFLLVGIFKCFILFGWQVMHLQGRQLQQLTFNYFKVDLKFYDKAFIKLRKYL